MKLNLPKRLELARLPTPIIKLERLSRILEGPDIYLKRDDLTGMELSGNKVRKLEFLLAEALDADANLLITCGGAQSNHARATAVAAARLGLASHLVLRNGISTSVEGNLLLSRFVGAEVTLVSAEEYQEVDTAMKQVAETAKREGQRPYIIPEGGSSALGALGYVEVVAEIAAQGAEAETHYHHLVSAVGSGGTLAGLVAGKQVYDYSAQIHGINVCDSADFFQKKVARLLQEMERFGKEFSGLASSDVDVIDGYVGKGYGLSSQNEIEVIKMVAREEGVILDPVYTGKAMVGLVDQIRSGRFKQKENILLLHTGGLFGLFPKRGLFF